jgi:methyl-accepting chemotaxis protein
MGKVTEMVSSIGTAIQEQEGDIEKVVAAVENISGMSEQVNRASVEQKRAAKEIERSMEDITRQFSGMSEQTEALQQNSDQIVTAMHTLESTTGQILQDTTRISGKTVKNLVHQSDVLQKIVNVFKVS